MCVRVCVCEFVYALLCDCFVFVLSIHSPKCGQEPERQNHITLFTVVRDCNKYFD